MKVLFLDNLMSATSYLQEQLRNLYKKIVARQHSTTAYIHTCTANQRFLWPQLLMQTLFAFALDVARSCKTTVLLSINCVIAAHITHG